MCNEDTTQSVFFSGNVTGSIFDWSHNYPSIGLAANGIGDIASFKATNTSFNPIVDTVSVMASANGCIGSPIDFIFTVNPTPNIQATNDTAYCNGTQSQQIIFNGGVVGTSFDWVNSNPSIGLKPNGVGDILPFTANNPSDSQFFATIIVTPEANNCIGVNDTFTITANPIPRVYTIEDRAYCNNELTDTIDFKGTVKNTSFNWTNSNSSIGLPVNGKGNINPFQAKNDNSIQSLALVTVTPVAHKCVGSSKDFDIRVNPTLVPTITIDNQEDNEICAGARATFLATTENEGSNPIYEWKINGVYQGKHAYKFSTLDLKDEDIVTCDLISNALCAEPAHVTSNSIDMVVKPNLIPEVTVSIHPDTNVELWIEVSYTANILNGGDNPRYIWMLNNENTVGNNGIEFNGKVGVDVIDGDRMCLKIFSNEKCLAIDSAFTCSDKINIANFYQVGTFDYVTLYPNPNEGFFRLKGNIYTEREIGLSVKNSGGKTVYSNWFSPLNNTVDEQIQLQELPNGLYYLTLNLDEDRRTIKFTITR